MAQQWEGWVIYVPFIAGESSSRRGDKSKAAITMKWLDKGEKKEYSTKRMAKQMTHNPKPEAHFTTMQDQIGTLKSEDFVRIKHLIFVSNVLWHGIWRIPSGWSSLIHFLAHGVMRREVCHHGCRFWEVALQVNFVFRKLRNVFVNGKRDEDVPQKSVLQREPSRENVWEHA